MANKERKKRKKEKKEKKIKKNKKKKKKKKKKIAYQRKYLITIFLDHFKPAQLQAQKF